MKTLSSTDKLDYVIIKERKKKQSSEGNFLFPGLKIGIVIPAYNEENNLGRTLAKIPKNLSEDTNIIVVDDGSKDNTCDIACKYDITLIKHPKNRGNGAAVTTGLKYCKKIHVDVAVIIDADGQHPPMYIKDFVDAIVNKKNDFAIGNRFKYYYDMNIYKKLCSKIMTAFYMVLLQKKVMDPTNGYRSISSNLLKKIKYESDYSITQEMLFKILPYYKYSELPIHIYQREHGQSFIKLKQYLIKMIYFFVKYYLFKKIEPVAYKLTSLEARQRLGRFLET